MAESVFRFKRFSIAQDKCAMKVGTDSVVLGSWTNPGNSKRILDIGTGTGILACMMAQKSSAIIDAVEIDETSAKQAKENCLASPWADRLNVLHCSIQSYTANTELSYDLIISNPPFFRDALRNPSEVKTLARHTVNLSFEDLLRCAKKLLLPEGFLAIILPINEADFFCDLAKSNGLFLNDVLRVKAKGSDEIEIRRVMKFSFKQIQHSDTTVAIENEERHSYTEEYKKLTADFYLKF
jgi:tRNA1Val (adenine37-N6)-methyltransferase